MTADPKTCRACGSALSVTMADLGVQPPSNAYLPSAAMIAQEKRYPLRVRVCGTCKLAQLDYDVPPQELFSDYAYFSSFLRDLARPCPTLLRDGARALRARPRQPSGRARQQRRLSAEKLRCRRRAGAGHRSLAHGRRRRGKDRRCHPGRVLRRPRWPGGSRPRDGKPISSSPTTFWPMYQTLTISSAGLPPC